MNLSKLFILRPVMTSLVMLGIFLFGLIAYFSLPTSALPDIAIPVITVTAQNPGSDAQTMANEVTTILEQQLMNVQGLKLIVSSSSYSFSQIVLQFDLNKTIESAATDVSQALTQAQGNLPPEMPNPPSYTKTNPADAPIMYVAVSSNTMTKTDLYDYAYTIVSQRFSMLEGVSKTQIYGTPRATRIQLNPDKMAAMNLGIDTVAKALKAANQQMAVGTVYDRWQSYTLYPLGQIKKAKDFNPVIITERKGSPIRISDIGNSIDGEFIKDYYLSYWNNQRGEIPTVVVAITKQSGANTVQLCNTIKSMLPELEKELPPSIKLFNIYDTAQEIEAAVRDVKFTLFLAFILVVLVIFLFLGKVTSTFIPCITLPMAIFGTFALMYVFGYNMDILSLLGLTLVVGFLVDDAIVVLENIVRHLEMGKKPLQAALEGSKQISTTVLSMTLALSAVFIPLIFMPGMIGKMFHEFAMVVVVAVLFSGFISLTLTPMLSAKLVRQEKGTRSSIESFSRRLMDRLLHLYEPMLRWVMEHRFVPITIVAICCGIAVLLFQVIPQDFLPAGDSGAIQGLTQASESVSLEQMQALQKAATDTVKKNPYVESIVSAANIWSFLPPNQGVVFFNLKPRNERPPIQTVLEQIKEELASVEGLKIFLEAIPEINLNIGTGIQRAEYQYSLSSIEDPQKLYAQAEELTKTLKGFAELEGVSNNIQNNTPLLKINILRDQASTYGITVKTIEEALNLGYAGGRTSTFNTPINLYNVIVEMENQYRLNPQALNKLYLTSHNPRNEGKLVPINTLVEWEESVGPMQVNHVNQLTSATLFFNLKQGAALGTVVGKINQAAEQVLSPTVLRNFQGSAQVFQKTMAHMGPLLMICILVIYLLLGSLYESYLQPITIFSTLPGAIFGGLFTLYIFGGTLSLYAYVGLIVLIGIVLKNGIMLIEFANEQVENGIPPYDAITQACKQRFRPILMTTVAASMGAVPIALGIGGDADSNRPLGLIVLGGLLFSQLISYFFTPVIYLYIEALQQKLKKNTVEDK